MSKACLVAKKPLADVYKVMHADYRCGDDIRVLMTAEEIQVVVQKLADRLNAYYCSKCTAESPLFILGLLTGVYPFAADLTRLLKFEFQIGFTKVTSYHSDGNQGDIRFEKDFVATYKDKKEVLILDELWDTGNSVKAIKEVLPHAKVCVAFCKGKLPENSADFCGLEPLPKVWLIGYGLDSDLLGRGYPCIVYRCLESAWADEVAKFRDGLLKEFLGL